MVTVSSLNAIIRERDATIVVLNAEIATLQQQIVSKDSEIAARDAEIADLQAQILALESTDPPVPAEMIVKSWYQEDLPEGPVAAWHSGGVKPKTAEQILPALQPVKLADNGGVLFANGTKQVLTWPADTDAQLLHRWWLVIARSAVSSGAVPVLSVNGNVNGGGHRQPLVNLKSGAFASSIQDPVLKTVEGPAEADAWNVMVCWRRGYTMQASVNGVPTSSTAIQPMATNNDDAASSMGCGEPTALVADMAVDCILLGQSEIDDATIDKLVGWGMWRVGRQAELPVGHPYRAVRPTGIDEPERFVFSTAEWNAWVKATDLVRFTHRGEPAPAITGYTTVFEDQFLTNTVVDDLQGAEGSNWFAPTHIGATVGADASAQKVNSVPSCYIHDPVNNTLSLRLQAVAAPNGTMQWRTGAFSSIDKNGQGRFWGKGIFEIRAKFPLLPKPRPGFWPAFWAYGVEHLFWRTRNRLETDFFEYDGLNGAWINSTQHVHAPRVPFVSPAVQPVDIYKKIAGYQVGPTAGFPALIDIYDGQFHTWYWQIEDDLTYLVIDGLEVARCPTSRELATEKYIMVDFAYRNNQGAGDPTQTYDMTIDYIRVRQKT